MSATNSTANYNLPVFLATDKPAWLTDWNGAMNAIDTAIHTAQATADGAQTTAGTATADIATINASLSTITSNISSLTQTVNGNTGSINTINSLIGNGQPTTEDKTLIGAINEIYAMIGGGTELEAENVTYDNTSSGLVSDDVQGAIDELHNSSNIAYDNTLSGLNATNVKSAIDELAVGGGGGAYDLNITAHTGNVTITNLLDPATQTGVGTGTDGRSVLRYAFNDDYSIGKIYGYLYLSIMGSGAGSGLTLGDWSDIATLTIPNMPAMTNSFNIEVGADLALSSGNTYNYESVAYRMKVNTNGTITLQVYVDGLSAVIPARMYMAFPACLYFISEFGD